MTTEQINKGNMLIARYLGADNQKFLNEFELYGLVDDIKDGPDEQHFFTVEDMIFHLDWNWLMPVVHRIRGEEVCENFNINITGDCLIEGLAGLDINVYCDHQIDTITATWMACVEFIQWVNQQNDSN